MQPVAVAQTSQFPLWFGMRMRKRCDEDRTGAVDGAVGAQHESASAIEQEADVSPVQAGQAADQFDMVKRLRLQFGAANIPHPDKVLA